MAFCVYCLEEVNTRVESAEVIRVWKGVEVKYIQQRVFCSKCGEEISVPEIEDRNLKALYDAYRKAQGLITEAQVLELSNKYKIGKRNLSKLMRWGEHTFERFCEGCIPSKQYSDEMLRLLNDTNYFAEKLEKNKDRIPLRAYCKAKSGLQQVQQFYQICNYGLASNTVWAYNMQDAA